MKAQTILTVAFTHTDFQDWHRSDSQTLADKQTPGHAIPRLFTLHAMARSHSSLSLSLPVSVRFEVHASHLGRKVRSRRVERYYRLVTGAGWAG